MKIDMNHPHEIINASGYARAAALWLLAESVVTVACAGAQAPTTVLLLGGVWETSRRVRVVQIDHESPDDSLGWEGPLSDWQGAVAECAGRPGFPSSGWAPGPYEAAAVIPGSKAAAS